jgi:predicted phage tail protein
MFRTASAVVVATALSLVLHVPSPVSGQTSGKDVAKKTGEAAEAIRDYTVEKKNQAVAEGRKLLKDADARIKQLDAKAAKATGEVKAKSQEEIKELKAKRALVSQKLDEMGKATAASWDSVKNGFADAYKDMHEAYGKAVARLR